jgi:hypothetical protein
LSQSIQRFISGWDTFGEEDSTSEIRLHLDTPSYIPSVFLSFALNFLHCIVLALNWLFLGDTNRMIAEVINMIVPEW